MIRFISRKDAAATGGGTGGPETDPVATAALNAHKVGVDPHADRAYADGRIAALVNAAPAALDTLAEIDAQLASDETGAAAMQASINGKAAQADLDAHINDAVDAHDASAVSVNPTGLLVVTTTDVQSALGQLDAWANGRPTNEAGLLAAMPANGARPNNSTYFATDQYGGTTYRMVAGAWVQQGAGVSQSSGQIVAGPVQLTAAFDIKALGTVWTDIPGMTVNIPASTRPVMVRFKGEVSITTGTAAANSSCRAWVALARSADNVIVALEEASTYVSGTTYSVTSKIVIEYYLPAPVAAATYKLQSRMQAATAGLTLVTLQPSNGIVAGSAQDFYAQAV